MDRLVIIQSVGTFGNYKKRENNREHVPQPWVWGCLFSKENVHSVKTTTTTTTNILQFYL